MWTYAHPTFIETGEQRGYVASFPDVPEAITEGIDRAEVESMASDALGVALLTYVEIGRALPVPSAPSRDHVMISADQDTCAKLALIEAFRRSGLTQAELAGRLGKDAREIRRLLDPNHRTKLGTMTSGLAVLGRRLVIGFEAA